MIKALPILIEDFLRYLRVQRGRHSLTIRNYRLYLNRFLNWCRLSQLKQAGEITAEKLRDYRLWLTRQKSLSGALLSAATQNYHLTALRSFVNYLQYKGVSTLPSKKITLNRTADRRVAGINKNEIKNIFSAVAQSHETPLIKGRDQALLKLIYSCGLKISELVKLQRSQVNAPFNELSILRQGKKVSFSLPMEVSEALKNYLTQRHDDAANLFIRHDRAAEKQKISSLTPRSVQRSLERYRKLAGLRQKITPHTLRHTYAFNLAAEGNDAATLQTKLGLKHRSTAAVYESVKNHDH